jgi:hypothetical protein
MAFGIKSLEHRTYHEVHEIQIDEPRGQKLLSVRITPPIPRWVYQTESDIDRAFLAPRYADTSFRHGGSKWPTIVNLCVSKSTESDGLAVLDIVEMRQRSSTVGEEV